MTTIDGVPVYFLDKPGSTTATLAFGVGHQDESYPIAGITHLIEHLAMSTVPRSHLEHNACVDMDQTTFFATGRPDAVADFIAQVCAGLSNLPVDRIAHEKQVLDSEEASSGQAASGPMWAYRFGLHGPGTLMVEHDHDKPAAAVTEHAHRYFTRANAALGIVGTMPDNLRLPLPAGSPVERPPLPVRAQRQPSWAETEVPAVGLLVSQPAGSAPAQLAWLVLEHRLSEVLRHELGLCYGVDSDAIFQAGRPNERLMLMDTREGVEAKVAQTVWAEFLALATTGPRSDDVAFVLDSMRHDIDLPEAAEAEVYQRLWTTNRGLPWRSDKEILASMEAVTRDEVLAAMPGLVASAVVFVPEDVDAFDGRTDIVRQMWCDGDQPLQGTSYRPGRLARAFSRDARKLTLVIGDQGVSTIDSDGDHHTIGWDQIVEIRQNPEDPAERMVIGRNGCIALLDSDVFGQKAIADFDRRYTQAVASGMPPALQR